MDNPSRTVLIQEILASIDRGRIDQAIDDLKVLKSDLFAAIPEKQRQSRGITWVVEQISVLFAQVCQEDEVIFRTALILFVHLEHNDPLLGVPIFMLADCGQRHPQDVFEFFVRAAESPDWVLCEFAAGAFRKVIVPNKEIVRGWLLQCACGANPRLRRFVAETLRPVTINQWLIKEPEYSLAALRLMFHEAHPYPRTSVGNNLSDLSRRQPELIFSIVQELVDLNNRNSAWIAYRACRNLVKKDPIRVMDILGVDEYHYKDRNYIR
jgi:3-methyladenine DNA glycosylase AlkC